MRRCLLALALAACSSTPSPAVPEAQRVRCPDGGYCLPGEVCTTKGCVFVGDSMFGLHVPADGGAR